MGVKHTALPVFQSLAVVSTVLGKLCTQKAKETELDAALFTQMAREGTLTLTFPHHSQLIGLCTSFSASNSLSCMFNLPVGGLFLF